MRERCNYRCNYNPNHISISFVTNDSVNVITSTPKFTSPLSQFLVYPLTTPSTDAIKSTPNPPQKLVPKARLLTSDQSLAMLKEKAKAKEEAALQKERKIKMAEKKQRQEEQKRKDMKARKAKEKARIQQEKQCKQGKTPSTRGHKKKIKLLIP